MFGGREPLDDLDLLDRFEDLAGISGDAKPWECVGDVDECRAAVALASLRSDRAATPVLRALVARLGSDLPPDAAVERLLRPLGAHFVPDAYATDDLLV